MWDDGDFNGDGQVNVFGDGFILLANIGQDVRVPANAVTSATNRIAANLQFEAADDSDDQENPAAAKQVTSESPRQPQLVLAGDQTLRDDVFGSDF